MATHKRPASPPVEKPIIVHMLPRFAEVAAAKLAEIRDVLKQAGYDGCADHAEVVDIIRENITAGIVARMRGDR